MTPIEYVQNAIKTESRPASLNWSRAGLAKLLKMLIVSSQIAEQSKRTIFYGKNLDLNKFSASLLQLAKLATEINGVGERIARVEDMTSELHQPNLRILHGAIGVFGEAGETLEAVLKQIETGELDLVNVGEEALGDVPWYQAVIADETGVSFEQGWETNIAKLKKRYGDAFSTEAALNRDTDAERTVLEDGLTPAANDDNVQQAA